MQKQIAILLMILAVASALAPRTITHFSNNGNKLHFESGYHLQNGGSITSGTPPGDRQIKVPVVFKNKFEEIPQVQANINRIDAQSGPNLRAQVFVLDVTTKGFTLVLNTWADTVLYSFGANWFAYGK